jgi:hypothetical protein
MPSVIHVVQVEDVQVTRIQLSYAEIAHSLGFWCRSQGYRVRYYRATEPARLDAAEISRCVNLLRDYGSWRRFLRHTA